MKFIPDSIARRISQQHLLASKNSPQILFGVGVVGMVGSTVLACRATLQLDEVLDRIEADKHKARKVKDLIESDEAPADISYTDSEYRKDLLVIGTRGIGSIAKLYAPSVLLGGASIICLTKSHSIMAERNLAITAAYAAIDGAFSRYRERVVERYGEEVDRDIRYESEEVDIIDEDTGKLTHETRAIGAPGSAYARWFDKESSTAWSKDPDINVYFLQTVQSYCNDRLKARGHFFLNEVYYELGMSHTKAGAVVGWRWNVGSGDDFIDFGCWEGERGVNSTDPFFNGREGAILLDFNVDEGTIYDKLEEGDHGL